MKIYPTKEQRILLDKFIDTSRYVYNRTLEFINKGNKINEKTLRDLLVTDNTKKGYDEYKEFDKQLSELKEKKKTLVTEVEILEIDKAIKNINQKRRDKMKSFVYIKNPLVLPFEIETPKDIRYNAVNRCCDAFKTGFINLKKGNINFFRMKYKKKTEEKQSIQLTKKIISIKNGRLQIAPETFKDHCILKVDKHNQRKLQNLKIENDVFIVRTNGSFTDDKNIKQSCKHKEYFVHITVPIKPYFNDKFVRICGVDPGIRTFATVHTNDILTNEITMTEYEHKAALLNKLNKKMDMLKTLRNVRKKQFKKIEKQKSDLIDKLHWDVINHLLEHNDVIYYGDIKSHDIVKGGKNKLLNRNFNDIKFFRFKQRLLYKAFVKGKKVFFVKENHTTKTCSCCGKINNNVGSKEIFECNECKSKTGRDFNASKNIKMKGIMTTL